MSADNVSFYNLCVEAALLIQHLAWYCCILAPVQNHQDFIVQVHRRFTLCCEMDSALIDEIIKARVTLGT